MRPGIFVSRTREKLGRTCDQIGRTLEPWPVKYVYNRKRIFIFENYYFPVLSFFSILFFISLTFSFLSFFFDSFCQHGSHLFVIIITLF